MLLTAKRRTTVSLPWRNNVKQLDESGMPRKGALNSHMLVGNYLGCKQLVASKHAPLGWTMLLACQQKGKILQHKRLLAYV